MKRAAAAALSLHLALPAGAEISGELVARLKPTVVNVERAVTVGLNSEGTGRTKASAFIVDAKRGILATNRHVSGTSPALFKVIFENGKSTDARILHYDAWHDFAFLKMDLSPVDFPLSEAELASSSELKEQQDVVMIGNNDAEEYSVKFGKVSNLVLDKGWRHSATLQTTFDRAGGSSGSPVFDEKGRVVAIHYAGTNTTSFELRSDYLRDALARLRDGGAVRRGDAGLDLALVLVSDARKHYHLPEEQAAKVLALREGLKYMLVVDNRVPGTDAADKLLPGDLLLELDGEPLGDDLYAFDRRVDEKVGGEVRLRAVRDGRSFEARLRVSDAEKDKTARFARFGGGVVHEPSVGLRLENNIDTPGVFLSQADNGSTMQVLGNEVGRGSGRYLVLVEGVNGAPTPDLASFLRAVKPLEDRQHVYFLVRDKHAHNTSIRAVPVTLDLRFSPLEVSRWDAKTLEWVRE